MMDECGWGIGRIIIGGEKQKLSKKNEPECHCLYHKYRTD
jgi:hypothetical protein